MERLVVVSQVLVAVGLLNVWLLRPGKATAWRGGDARTMAEEFAAYGLPAWSRPVIGGLKVGLALLLLAGIWIPGVARPVAAGVAVLMVGAVAMHVKIGDPPHRSLPALSLMLLSTLIAAA